MYSPKAMNYGPNVGTSTYGGLGFLFETIKRDDRGKIAITVTHVTATWIAAGSFAYMNNSIWSMMQHIPEQKQKSPSTQLY